MHQCTVVWWSLVWLYLYIKMRKKIVFVFKQTFSLILDHTSQFAVHDVFLKNMFYWMQSLLLLFFLLGMQDYNAKLSDFGLAREGPIGDDTHVSTRIMGTYGYAAPEYIATGNILLCTFLNVSKHCCYHLYGILYGFIYLFCIHERIK